MIESRQLASRLARGNRVAVADGAGCPVPLLGALSDAAAEVGDIDLLLGWAPVALDGLRFDAFRSVRTLMGGYALRGPLDDGRVDYAVNRLGAAPALLAGPLRPDVLVASVGAGDDGHRFLTEVAWLRAAVAAGATVLAVERPAVPVLDVGPPIPPERLFVVGESARPAPAFDWSVPSDADRSVAERVAALVPEGVRLQHAPGSVGAAVVDAMRVPVAIDTGVVTDVVVDLARRGLLLGRPLTPYVVGTERVYDWAAGRVDVDGVEHTHHLGRLMSDPPLVAVNTALEIDLDGQVNVERVGDSAVAGIGGQPDYAAGACLSPRGLSIVALPTRRGPHRTLVERLQAPASTPAHDVDVVVTERGHADLRGLSRPERRRAISTLWD